MSWKDKVSFLAPTYIEHEVGGETLKFWPVSLGVAVKLRAIGAPLAEALSILFAPTDNDATVIIREFEGGDGGKEKVVEAVDPKLAEMRDKQRADALSKAIKTLSDSKNLGVIGEIIMDSMRENFPKSEPRPPGLEVMNELPLKPLKEIIMGIVKANKDVLGPFAEKAQERLGQVIKLPEEEEPAA